VHTVTAVSAKDAPEVWHIVAPLLRKAVVRTQGRYSMRTVFKSLQKSTSLLWVVYTPKKDVVAALVTRTVAYPTGLEYLNVDLLGGNGAHDWIEDVDKTLSSYARDLNMSGVELYGRTGWAKILKPFGWHSNVTSVSKVLA